MLTAMPEIRELKDQWDLKDPQAWKDQLDLREKLESPEYQEKTEIRVQKVREKF